MLGMINVPKGKCLHFAWRPKFFWLVYDKDMAPKRLKQLLLKAGRLPSLRVFPYEGKLYDQGHFMECQD